jgi:type I restriction enzyme S subunit
MVWKEGGLKSMNTDYNIYPTDWKLSTVGRECNICNNLREPLSEEERATLRGPYPYYGPTKAVDCLDHFRVEGTYALIGEDGDHFLKYNDQDMTQLVNGRFNVNNHAHIVQGGKRCSTEWFYTFFRKRCISPFLTRQGAGRFKLNKAALERIPILIPPRPEQNLIHGIIIQWDRAIDLTERLIAANQERRTWLMQQLLTGKQRLTGFDTPWKEVQIGDYLTESRIQGSHGKIARKITVKLYGLGVLSKNDIRDGSENTKYYIRKKGQFIYSKLDFLNGAFGIIPQELDGHESTLDLPCFDFRGELEPKFLLNLVSRDAFYTRFLGSAMGGRKARRVNPSEFLAIGIKLPSIEEQKAIIDAIDLANREINLLRTQLDALREQKKGLMQQLLTGKIRVKV